MKRCIIKFNHTSAGFSSDYLTVVSSVVCAVNEGFDPYVDSSNTWFNPTYDFNYKRALDLTINPWDWWFDQSKEGIDINTPTFWINRASLGHNPKTFMTQPLIDHHIDIAQKYIKVKKHILDKIDNFYNENFKGKKTLGVVARGTENLTYHPEYPKVFADEWPDRIKKYTEKYPVDVIFLGACDDNEILDSILNSFDNVVYLKDIFRKTTQTQEDVLGDVKKMWWVTPLEGSVEDHRKRLGDETLLSTQLIAKCDHFLGAYSGLSNISRFFNNKKFKSSDVI